jgi:insertion element IS1 protein InsB
VAKKKIIALPNLASTLLAAVEQPVLELDELWSFVFSKQNKRWVWLAKARQPARNQKVIPAQQHQAVGKDSGETAHIERWNNTLRQRLARFTRQSLAFSKSDFMHQGCLLLFLHRFNHEIIL